MTFVEFIKSRLSVESPVGDLANDIMNDEKFPINKTSKDIINYLDFKTKIGGTKEVFKELVAQYENYLLASPKNDGSNKFLDSRFSVFSSEKWGFYKKHFSIDKVYLIGTELDIYKIYCENTKSRVAIYMDIKSKNDLNNISIIDAKKIPIGEYTKKTSVKKAINILENCPYETPIKPDSLRFIEILNFLKSKESL